MKAIATTFVAALLGFTFNASANASPSDHIDTIEDAHAGSTYNAQQAVQADFVADFGPMHLDGTMWFTPSMGRVRLELEGGIIIVYDGQTAWLSPADAAVPGPPARFHVLTWPYFVAVPYKLDDPGTAHADAGAHPIRSADEVLPGTKITFGEGVGDTPDDWYMAFADPDTGYLTALSYIVTYGVAAEEANKQASIVLYDDFVDVDGVPFATTWTFHYWTPGEGLVGEPKGNAKLSNIAFVDELPADAFVKPEGAVEAKAP
ncbi:MAG: hypothetical protein AAF593_09095 [Planctomycetota bacterium]